MLKLVSTFCLLIIAGNSFSQSIGGIEDESIAENIPAISVMNKPVSSAIMDSVSAIPFYSEYGNFTSAKVHPYKVDLSKMTDTIALTLLHSECDYAHSVCGKINSDFGYRKSRFHYGIDVDLNIGDKVLSSFEGMIRVAKYDRTYGKVIVIRHQNGLETLYAHLSKLEVEVGDYVQAGDVIALGGNTGRSTGPHLHFEVRYLGEPINPHDIIDFENGQVKNGELILSEESFAYLKEIRKRKYYRVRSGDSLSRIAYCYGVSISKLCSLNRISRNSILQIGQKIRYN